MLGGCALCNFRFLTLAQDNFPSIGQDDTAVAYRLEALDRGLDLLECLAGTELGVQCLLEQKVEERVAVRVQDGGGRMSDP